MGRGFTYEAAAQACLGDSAIVGVATQVELLIQVQTLELALDRGKSGMAEAERRWGGARDRGTGLGLTWEVPLTGARLPTIREPWVRLRSRVTVWNWPSASGVG